MTFFPPGVEFGDRTLPAILIAATLIYILFPGPIEPDTEYLVRVKGFFLFKAEKEFLTTSSYRTDRKSATMASKTRIELSFTTGENTSLKSTPSL